MTKLVRLLIIAVIIYFGPLGPVFGFEHEMDKNNMRSPIIVTRVDSQVNPTGKISSDENISMDERYANGLTHFYDGDFRPALTIFKNLQRVDDHVSLSYLAALCQYRLGDVANARDSLIDTLDKDPGHHAARIALMELYAVIGDDVAAARQMQYLEDGPIEDDHRILLDPLKRRIDQRSEKSRYFLSIAQGFRWNSNINAGSDNSEIIAPDGSVFNLDEEDRTISDWSTTTHLYGWYRHDPASFASLFWDTSTSLYHLNYFAHSEYNYTDLRLSTGPVWKRPTYYFGLPVGYRTSLEDGDAYSRDIYIQPVFTYTLNKHWAVQSTFHYGNRSHADSADDALDKEIRRIDLQPIFTIHNTSISAGLGWLSASANDTFFSYQGVEVSLSAGHEWTDRTSMSVGYRHRRTKYQGVYTGWFEKREDEANSIHVSVTHEIGKHWAWDATTSWFKNHSNTELFEYERFTAGLKVFFKF